MRDPVAVAAPQLVESLWNRAQHVISSECLTFDLKVRRGQSKTDDMMGPSLASRIQRARLEPVATRKQCRISDELSSKNPFEPNALTYETSS